METIIILPLLFIFIALSVLAIWDVRHNKRISKRSKWNFYILIIWFPILGALIYFAFKSHEQQHG